MDSLTDAAVESATRCHFRHISHLRMKQWTVYGSHLLPFLRLILHPPYGGWLESECERGNTDVTSNSMVLYYKLIC